MEAAMDLHRQLTDLCDAFNAHDLDLIMTYFAEDCILEMPRGHDPWGSRFEGKAKVREALAMRFRGLPDVTYNDASTSLMRHAKRGYPDGCSLAPR
jgi:ketosteroid isomerase-like protein